MTAPSPEREEHWTKTLYERYPDLYLPILESRKEAGAAEAEMVAKVLQSAGIRRGKVLDLACGIGRHSIPLAKLGYEVVGYDLSTLFVERARSWASSEGLGKDRLRFYQGDIRNAGDVLLERREEGFMAVVNLFSSLGAYGEEEDKNVLEGILKVCSPGCLLLVETLNRDFLLKRFQPFSYQQVSEDLRLLNFARFNPEESRLEDEWKFYKELPDGTLKPELVLRVSGRVYTLQEMRALVVSAGWSYLGSFGNLMTRAPISAESPSIVIVSRKP